MHDIDRIDNLVAAEGFSLQAWDDRQSQGVWVLLGPTSSSLDTVRELTQNADEASLGVYHQLVAAQWVPIASGRTLQSALIALEARLDGIPQDQLTRGSTWTRAVSGAYEALSNASRVTFATAELREVFEELPRLEDFSAAASDL